MGQIQENLGKCCNADTDKHIEINYSDKSRIQPAHHSSVLNSVNNSIQRISVPKVPLTEDSAAIKLQSVFRGKMYRKRYEVQRKQITFEN